MFPVVISGFVLAPGQGDRVSSQLCSARSPKHICPLPLLVHSCQPTFLMHPFQVDQAFILTVIVIPNVPCKQTDGK